MKEELKIECPWEVKTNIEPKERWEEEWECIRNTDDEAFFITKQTFSHEEENLNFEYKYMIQFADNHPYAEDEEPESYINLFLVPLAKYFQEETIQQIRKDYELEEDIEIPLDVLLEYKQCPVLEKETNNMLFKEPWTKDKKVNDFLCKASISIKAINNIRKFFLDKPENALGVTGWDYLKEILWKDYNAIKETLNRYEKGGN